MGRGTNRSPRAALPGEFSPYPQNNLFAMARVSGDYPQIEVPGERIEIAVVVQQLIPALDASGRNHRIDGLADRHAFLAQAANILRRLNGNIPSAQLHQGQHSQLAVAGRD